MFRPALVLMCYFFVAICHGQTLILSEQGKNPLASFVYFMADENELDIEDIIAESKSINWQHNQKNNLNLGYNQAPHWLKLNVINQYASDNQRVLEISHPPLDQVSLFVVNEHGKILTRLMDGDQVKQEDKTSKHPNIVFALELPFNEPVTVYLRVQTDGAMQLPLTLWRWQAFNEKTLWTFILQGVFYGMVIIMFIYNLMIWIFDRQGINLKYTIYISFITLYLSYRNGIGLTYLWPSFIWLNNIIPILSIGLTLASLNYFVSDFFTAKEKFPKIHISLKYSFKFYCLATLICLFVKVSTASIILSSMTLVSISLIVAITVYMLKIKHPDANYFSMAWLFLAVGGVLFIGGDFGFIPITSISKYGLQFGVSIELMFLSLAMADRMTRLQKEKNIALEKSVMLAGQIQTEQEKTFNAELENMRLEKEHSHKLEMLVDERTQKLHQALNNLSLAHDKLQTISITDALTELHNRYYFNEHWRIEYKRAFREQSHLTLIFLDIDHFKQVNDGYGHPAGDMCLKEVARAIKHHAGRDQDIVCRYGGEEFVVILPGTDELGAIAVAESIRQQIAKLDLSWQGSGIKLTASLGISSLTPKNNQNKNRQFMVNQADQALYQAKHRGRNQVVVFEYDIA